MSNGENKREKCEEEAAFWMWRLDRGLAADEQDAFFDWLAVDPLNSAALAKYRQSWKRLDNLAAWLPEYSEKPNPDLLAPSSKPKVLRYISFSMAAVAVLALSALVWQANNKPVPAERPVIARNTHPENRTALEDGSVVKLKDDARVTVLYALGERRVRLDRGEAFFIVAKDADRPFVVEVQGVDVSALGTAFNVRLDSDSFEVLVSEGVVKVGTSKKDYDKAKTVEDENSPLLAASQRAIVSFTRDLDIPEIATLTKGEIHRVLAWQHGLMTFSSKPLSEIAYELNHFNETQMTVLDEELAKTRFSGSFRSDNMEGFVRLLEAAFGAKAEWNGDSEILLSKKVD